VPDTLDGASRRAKACFQLTHRREGAIPHIMINPYSEYSSLHVTPCPEPDERFTQDFNSFFDEFLQTPQSACSSPMSISEVEYLFDSDADAAGEQVKRDRDRHNQERDEQQVFERSMEALGLGAFVADRKQTVNQQISIAAHESQTERAPSLKAITILPGGTTYRLAQSGQKLHLPIRISLPQYRRHCLVA
jgi:hypothetical protein